MRYFVLMAALLSGCAATGHQGPTSTERMRADVGKPISYPIMRNGPPESIVRVNDRQVAYTFLKKAEGIYGGGVSSFPAGNHTIVSGAPIRSYSVECRYTLFVEAPRDNMPADKLIVVDFVPPKPGCE